MKILLVVGTRPNLVKASALLRAFQAYPAIDTVTGAYGATLRRYPERAVFRATWSAPTSLFPECLAGVNNEANC